MHFHRVCLYEIKIRIIIEGVVHPGVIAEFKLWAILEHSYISHIKVYNNYVSCKVVFTVYVKRLYYAQLNWYFKVAHNLRTVSVTVSDLSEVNKYK